MDKSPALFLAVFAVSLATVSSLSANGVSLYEKVAVEEHSTLVFVKVDGDELPDSQRIILDCRPMRDPSCAARAVDALERELAGQETPNMQAWKHFLLGTVHFQRQSFNEALESFGNAFESAADSAFKAAALHRTVDIHVILRDMRSALAALEALRVQFPGYTRYDDDLSTYPRSLCDHAWFTCTEPTSLKELQASVAVLQEMDEKQQQLDSLQGSLDRDEYVRTATGLGTLREDLCPTQTVFDHVCPDAVEIYGEIYDRFPGNPDADFAFLRLQQARFVYEYEGDVVLESKDIIRLYTPFLEQYPNSTHAGTIRDRVLKAEESLRLVPPQGTWQEVLEGVPVHRLALDSRGRVFFVNNDLGYVDDRMVTNIDVEGACADPHIFLDPADRIWYSQSKQCGRVASNALIRLDGQQRESFAQNVIAHFDGFDTKISAVLERRDGQVWFGTKAYQGSAPGGLFRLDGADAVRSGRNLANVDNVNVLAEDAAGVLWIGTGGDRQGSGDHEGGLTSYDGAHWRFYGTQSGLAHAYVNDVAFGPQGEVWVATDGGLTRIKHGGGDDNSALNSHRYTTHNSALPGGKVRALDVGPDGVVWLCVNASLVRFDGTYWTVYDRVEYSDVLAAPDGRILVASQNGISVLTPPHVTAVEGQGDPVPTAFALEQNRPNPFNASTTIPYVLPRERSVELRIYNLAGQPVRTWVLPNQAAGRHQTLWDGTDDEGMWVGSGVYLYRLDTGEQHLTRRLVLVK